MDGSGWKAVYDILKKDGYDVTIVQNSTASLDGDVSAAKRAIADAKGDVTLVGHSYGGAVITEAGNDPRSLAWSMSRPLRRRQANPSVRCPPTRPPVLLCRLPCRPKTIRYFSTGRSSRPPLPRRRA